MTLGVLALFVYMPVSILFLLGVFKKELAVDGPFKFLAPIADLALNYGKALEAITLVLAVGVGAYTGFLLSAMNSYPLFNHPCFTSSFLGFRNFSGVFQLTWW